MIEPRKCVICNNLYMPNRWNQKTCPNEKCRKKYNSLKQCEYIKMRIAADPAYKDKRCEYYRAYIKKYLEKTGRSYYLSPNHLKNDKSSACRKIIEYCRRAGLSPKTTNAMVLDGGTVDIRMKEIGYKGGMKE